VNRLCGVVFTKFRAAVSFRPYKVKLTTHVEVAELEHRMTPTKRTAEP